MEEDNEVRMRARRVTRSRGRSLEIEGYSYDDENDSRLIHNVSSNFIFANPQIAFILFHSAFLKY